MELERVKALGVKPPQNLWEYKVNSIFSMENKYWAPDYQLSACPLLMNTSDKTEAPCVPAFPMPVYPSWACFPTCVLGIYPQL